MSTPDQPRTLAKANCQVHGSHTPAIRRLGGMYTVEAHHIHPLGFGGPDVKDNIVYICPTGHSAVHELLRAEIKNQGQTSWQIRRHYSKGERALAFDGYNRIKAAGKLPEVRRTLGLDLDGDD